MKVKIYRPARNVMQSGRARTESWVLEAVLSTPRRPEPLMGWSASGDTDGQIRLTFATREEALACAARNGWEVSLLPERERRVVPRNYADKFRYIPPSLPAAAPSPESEDRPRSASGRTPTGS